ncbi:MAG: hypothetical protein ABI192_16215 [Bradyrhizobium sp.]
MPPRSYVIIAIVLAALVAGGFPDKFGFSISRWYQWFDVITCLVAVPGAFRIARGLHTRFWVGIALASPGLVCGAINLYGLTNRINRPVSGAFNEVADLAVLAAAAAAIHLAETLSARRTAFRVGYWILVIAALTTCLGWLGRPMGWIFTQDFLFALVEGTANTAAIFVKYGAFIGAAMLIVTRRDIERWTGIVIGLTSAYLLYRDLRPLFVDDGFTYYVGWTFWAWPGAMLVGGAAVWRMGSLLHASPVQAHPFGAEPNRISNEIPAPVRPEARPFVSHGVAIYFGVLFALTFIAFLREAIGIAMFMLIVPGLILIAAPTLLYYSTAVLPAYFVDRYSGKRLLAVAIAAASLASAAVLPHYVSWYLLGRLVASDHSDPPSSFQPKSFQLPYPEADNYWTNKHRPESHLRTPPPPCTDLCQQLLFRGHVEQVLIRDPSTPWNDGTIRIQGGTLLHLSRDGSRSVALPPAQLSGPKWRRFRLQQRETCPDTLSLIEGQFVRDVVGGKCLVEDTIDSADPDAILSISKPPAVPVPRREGPNIDWRSIQTGPMTVTIEERRDQRTATTEVKTALEAHYAPLPFYFSVKPNGLSFNLVVATDRFPSSFADPYEMVSRRYGLSIVPISWATRFAVPASDDDRSLVNTILNRDYGPGGYIPITPSRLVASFVNARLTSGHLNQDDVELIRVLLKQHAFTAPIESKLPPSTYPALKPLLPDMVERIADRLDGQNEMVQSLNVILHNFSAEDVDPYLSALCNEPRNRDLHVCYKREFRSRKK